MAMELTVNIYSENTVLALNNFAQKQVLAIKKRWGNGTSGLGQEPFTSWSCSLPSESWDADGSVTSRCLAQA